MQLSSRSQTPRRSFTVDRYTLFAAAVIAGILLAVPAITFLYVRGRLDPLLVLAGIVGVIVALGLFRVSERGNKGIVLLIIAAGMLSFVSLPTGRESRIPLSMLVALVLVALWLLSMLWGKPPTRLKPSPINRPLIAFVAVSIISYFWSQIFRDPLLFVWGSFPMVQVAALVVNILLPLTLLYVANQVTEVKWLKYLVAVVLVFGVASTLLYFLDPGINRFFFYRGTRGLFSMWVAAFAYGLALFHKGLKPWQRALLLALVLLLVYRYFFLGRSWVSGWLPLGVACIVITWFRSRRLFFICMTIGLIYFTTNFAFYYQNIVIAEQEGGSGTDRVELWVRNLTHVANHPVLGMGPAGYAPYNMTYHAEDARSTHNNYFDILAQTGVIGFVTFLLIIVQLWRIGRRSVRRYAGRRDFEEMYTVVAYSGVFGMAVGMMLGDWALPFAYNETIAGFDNAVLTWVLLGGMVALEMISREASAPQPDAQAALPVAPQSDFV
jgi:O-antigen ligase